jgi:hypothetical protein
MIRYSSTRLESNGSFENWLRHTGLSLLEEQQAESRRRQRQALRAWKMDQLFHRAIQLAWWTALALFITLAFLGFSVVCHLLATAPH